ncbi:hypothetical protein NDU88_003146 [Pleurodeles waltl]|uniref:Uncharacterized protein n=1 Tax=Pleurodeles waltl TaxID=8319 RepID=A0AAV7SFN4_PLEWA|nr:hypothetical protein NDU88_003146 [Pleurodeles waltl]
MDSVGAQGVRRRGPWRSGPLQDGWPFYPPPSYPEDCCGALPEEDLGVHSGVAPQSTVLWAERSRAATHASQQHIKSNEARRDVEAGAPDPIRKQRGGGR